jgi:hypothetical protein
MIEGKSLRIDLQHLSRSLRKLHKALLDVETQYFGQVGSALEHLQLVTNHPHFAWLQKLSGVIAELDECLDDEEALAVDLEKRFRAEVEGLIGPLPAVDVDFRKRYNAMLHDAPEVAMAHGAVRSALSSMPTQTRDD